MRKGYLCWIILTILTLPAFRKGSTVQSSVSVTGGKTKSDKPSTFVSSSTTITKLTTPIVSSVTVQTSTLKTIDAARKNTSSTTTIVAAPTKASSATIMIRKTSNFEMTTEGTAVTAPTSSQTSKDTFAKKGVKGENKRYIIYVGIIIALTMFVAILLMVITYYFYRNRTLKLSIARKANDSKGIEEPVDLLPDDGDGETIENKGEEAGDTATKQDGEITEKQDEEVNEKQDEEISTKQSEEMTAKQDEEVTPNQEKEITLNQDEEKTTIEQDEGISEIKLDEEITKEQDEEINEVQSEEINKIWNEAISTSPEITTEQGDDMVNQQDEKEAYNHDNVMTVKETEF
ncbi:uncharacterized protein LOC114542942 [Dendronephthya gigantea]|uniref:uncharacterized protein LOC114542942 n=1 Tax=Dendronephthya gigantea TaxID=151771 RepID=UPI001069BDAD|nr:uncharacterized protein LOC114542942 [Dendronephthya gigantea]